MSTCYENSKSSPIEDTTRLDITYMLDKYKSFVDQKLVTERSIEIPASILPKGFTGTLTDVKTKGYGGPQEDQLYSKNEELRLHLPRGTTYITIVDTNKNTTYSEMVIFGNRKFTGSPADEDDSLRPTYSSLYFISPLETAKKVICIEKLNGEAAHFSGIFIGGVFFLVAGSKNCHILFNSEEQIELYTEDRFRIAKIVARTVYKYWQSLNDSLRNSIEIELHESRNTIVCELLQPAYQHLISFDTYENAITAFTITPPPKNGKVETLISMSPEVVLDKLKSYNLKVPKYEIISPDEVNSKTTQIRNEYDLEGMVLYYVDEHDHTIALIKVKTKWYIILRALREKTIFCFYTKKHKMDTDDAILKSLRRIDEFVKWLELNEGEIHFWKNLYEQWFIWLEKIKDNFKADTMRAEFINQWKKFLEECDLNDRI